MRKDISFSNFYTKPENSKSAIIHSYLVAELVETLEYLKVGSYPRGHVVKLYPDLLHVFQDAAVTKYPSHLNLHAGY